VGTAKEWGVFALVNGCVTPGGRAITHHAFNHVMDDMASNSKLCGT